MLLASMTVSTPASESAPSAYERTVMCESFCRDRLAVWQTRLGLEMWHISVVMTRKSEFKPNTIGNIHWDPSDKTAVIRVLDPADYKIPLPYALEDMENTVVHELVHLEISPVASGMERTEINVKILETTVNRITAGLLGTP
jgi:hypothetical protein